MILLISYYRLTNLRLHLIRTKIPLYLMLYTATYCSEWDNIVSRQREIKIKCLNIKTNLAN